MIDLKEMFGKKYVLDLDESYAAERFPEERAEKWRYYEIRGEHGFVYNYSANMLAVTFNNNRQANKLKGRKIIQLGDFERTVLFPLEDAPLVFKLIHPKRRRTLNLTAEARQAIGQRLRKARKAFLKASSES